MRAGPVGESPTPVKGEGEGTFREETGTRKWLASEFQRLHGGVGGWEMGENDGCAGLSRDKGLAATDGLEALVCHW